MRRNGDRFTLFYLPVTILSTFPSHAFEWKDHSGTGRPPWLLPHGYNFSWVAHHHHEYSASIVAHDHNSTIGITHLVVVSSMSTLGNKHPALWWKFDQSLISLLFVFCSCAATCSTKPRRERADSELALEKWCSLTVILITMCMYLGSLIALSVVPTSRADYLAGQSDNNSTALTDHPYYGIFVFDIIIVWVEGFGCISGVLVLRMSYQHL